MRLFLILILHFSLVLISQQRQFGLNEVYSELNKGFPVGSLLTIYFEHTGDPNWDNSVNIELMKDPSNKTSDRLQFKLREDGKTPIRTRELFSTAQINKDWDYEKPINTWVPRGEPEIWWRFDLYKISDSEYLPFFNGFVGFVRTMSGVETIKSVHLTSQNMANFDKSEVYINLRLPNTALNGSISPTPDMVRNAMNADSVEDNRKKVIEFKELDNFPIGKKIKLSVLMQSPIGDNANKEKNWEKNKNMFYSTLVFANKERKWGFGICNKYYGSENTIKLQLFVDRNIETFDTIHWLFEDVQFSGHRVQDCTFSSSADLLHILLEHTVNSEAHTVIKIRIIYKDSPEGRTCEIVVPAGEVHHLDKSLTIFGKQGATILHMKI